MVLQSSWFDGRSVLGGLAPCSAGNELLPAAVVVLKYCFSFIYPLSRDLFYVYYC